MLLVAKDIVGFCKKLVKQQQPLLQHATVRGERKDIVELSNVGGKQEQVFEKLAEFLTAEELEKMAQVFLAKGSELKSDTKGSKQTATTFGNLVSLAQPDKGTFHANWILDSGASRHVTGTSSEFSSYTSFPPIFPSYK